MTETERQETMRNLFDSLPAWRQHDIVKDYRKLTVINEMFNGELSSLLSFVEDAFHAFSRESITDAINGDISKTYYQLLKNAEDQNLDIEEYFKIITGRPYYDD